MFLAVCARAFNRFWFWTVVYARGFAQQVPFRTGMELFWGSSGDIATANWPLLIAALLGVLLLGSAKSAGRLRWFVLAYFAFSFECLFGLLLPSALFRRAPCSGGHSERSGRLMDD